MKILSTEINGTSISMLLFLGNKNKYELKSLGKPINSPGGGKSIPDLWDFITNTNLMRITVDWIHHSGPHWIHHSGRIGSTNPA